jgi:predicted DNA-binding protein (UPF0251 family)
MSLTAEQLAEFGLTPEEGQDLLRLTTKIEQNQKAKAENSEVARRSFGEWLSDVLPKVARALGIAASAVSKLLNSITGLINALN